MSRASRLANHIERTVTGPMWHGPALIDLLDGVDASRARARPIAGAHSIWEIVQHVTAWAEIARQRMRGESLGDPAPEQDWPPVGGEWGQAIERLKESHRLLAADVRPMSDADLDAKVKSLEYPVGVLLDGVVEHGTYHGGQLALLKKNMSAKYFKTAAEFRRWLAANHANRKELLVGFYKRASGRGGISYKEAVDEALCYGWIDGVKARVDEQRYTHRFSPRQAGSIWSLINARRVKELIATARMAKPGLEAWQRRDPKKTGIYSFENRPKTLEPALQRTFRAEGAAWAFFSAQPSGYQRLMVWYVMSAKQPETRASRLARVIKTSAEGKRIR